MANLLNLDSRWPSWQCDPSKMSWLFHTTIQSPEYCFTPRHFGSITFLQRVLSVGAGWCRHVLIFASVIGFQTPVACVNSCYSSLQFHHFPCAHIRTHISGALATACIQNPRGGLPILSMMKIWKRRFNVQCNFQHNRMEYNMVKYILITLNQKNTSLKYPILVITCFSPSIYSRRCKALITISSRKQLVLSGDTQFI